MRKILAILGILIFVLGCTNQGKSNNVRGNEQKTTVNNNLTRVYIADIDFKKNESFYLSESDMLKVIKDGVNKTKVYLGGARYAFDIDYGLLRDFGNSSEVRYKEENVEALKNMTAKNIEANGIGMVIKNMDDADYIVFIEIPKILVIDEGILTKRALLEYRIDIKNKNGDLVFSSWPALAFNNIKKPIYDSVNSVIAQDVCSKFKGSVNNREQVEELPITVGKMTKYQDFIGAMDNFKVVRQVSKVEGRIQHNYTVTMDWERFFYYKR